eukprot:CAMPEP_0197471594 /NCGR_PEP_ID=MMETSP1309-20131121/2559_1 /TAXON_ID=464262 /ORGANISM="Genus nov. species nov., Strain RCC998" /LENGTH=176 /DNA_ID=CAMNT_0043009457 /DNA_START=309 /DNA_END=839 /DNA_ORIENTATION=+
MADVLDFRQEHAQQQVHLRPMAAACGRKRTFGEATNLPQQHEQGTCGFKRSRGIEREAVYHCVGGDMRASGSGSAGTSGRVETKQQAEATAQQVQELQKENSILKKAVAIQNEKLALEEERKVEAAKLANVLRQALAQAHEQIRQLELANYSLKAHVKQMSSPPGGSLLGGPPDIF